MRHIGPVIPSLALITQYHLCGILNLSWNRHSGTNKRLKKMCGFTAIMAITYPFFSNSNPPLQESIGCEICRAFIYSCCGQRRQQFPELIFYEFLKQMTTILCLCLVSNIILWTPLPDLGHRTSVSGNLH
jgi:hypothetical protein